MGSPVELTIVVLIIPAGPTDWLTAALGLRFQQQGSATVDDPMLSAACGGASAASSFNLMGL
jgi:hypothetical protein